MSTFLGPIHYWLFQKIRNVEDREEAVIKAFSERFGDGVAKIVEDVRESYGMPFDNTPLEHLIGDAAIHYWLQSAIEKAETREAALLKGLIDRFGEEGEELAMEVAFQHGKKIGKAAIEEGKNQGEGVESVYNLIKNTFLDGMPCDHVTEAENPSTDLLVEKHTDCLHRSYWERAGISGVFMCSYLERWIKGVCSADSRIDYKRVRSIVTGDSYCEDHYRIKGV